MRAATCQKGCNERICFGSMWCHSFISGLRVERLVRETFPFHLIILLGLIMIILVPQMSLGSVDLMYGT